MPLNQQYLSLIARAVPQTDVSAGERLSRLYDLVVKTNEEINITSLISPIDVTLKHFIDSLSLFSHPEFQKRLDNGEKLCDVGCGGGFPGLPIACLRPDADLTMIDSTEKKIEAVKRNAEALLLPRVKAVWGRGEELAAPKASHREKYGLCVSRAVASLPTLCELCLPFVKPGGLFFAMKGMKAEEEVKASRNAIPMLGCVLREVIPISFLESFAQDLSFGEEEEQKIQNFASSARFLVVIEKIKPTLPIYPRPWAKMTKKSL